MDYQFKESLSENYVLQQFQGQFDMPCYFVTTQSEVDFLLELGTELKSEHALCF